MGRRVDARDVLDANAKTRRAFRGRIIGHFRRTGPNAWDDYEYVSDDDGSEIDVLPGLYVQMERVGADLRMRSHGRVIRVRWIPQDKDLRRTESNAPSALRQWFVERFVETFEDSSLGGAAVIARKLRG